MVYCKYPATTGIPIPGGPAYTRTSYYVISYDNHYIFMIVFYGLVLL